MDYNTRNYLFITNWLSQILEVPVLMFKSVIITLWNGKQRFLIMPPYSRRIKTRIIGKIRQGAKETWFMTPVITRLIHWSWVITNFTNTALVFLYQFSFLLWNLVTIDTIDWELTKKYQKLCAFLFQPISSSRLLTFRWCTILPSSGVYLRTLQPPHNFKPNHLCSSLKYVHLSESKDIKIYIIPEITT